jgi:hypothetical protein
MNSNLCECGCGEKTNIIKKTCISQGRMKGALSRFKRGHHTAIDAKGSKNKHWKGGRSITKDGYIRLCGIPHLRTKLNGYIGEHVLIAEKILGKPIYGDIVVHHADGNKSNNIPSNLVICQNQAYHLLLHQRMRALKESGFAYYRKCWHCKKYDKPSNLKNKSGNTYHNICENIYRKKLQERKGERK